MHPSQSWKSPMTDNASDVAFTLAVKGFQEKKDSHRGYARMEEGGG